MSPPARAMPVPDRPRSLSVLDELEMPSGPSLPRALSRGATAGETPMSRTENTTSERPPSIITEDDPLGDDDDAIPDGLPIDLDSGPVATDPDELVPVRPDVGALQVAVFEESAHLTSAQSAIAAAGHTVTIGVAGRDHITRVVHAVRSGGIDIVIASLPGGEPIIEAAKAVEPRPIVIASLSGSSLTAIARADAAGADLAITRPHDVDRLAPIMLAAARLHMERRVAVFAQTSRIRLDELAEPEPRSLLELEMFQRVLELEITRARRFDYPLSVALFAVEVAPPPPPAGIRGILRARAGNALINALRDIDIATQLEHERFLVLLPYTDLKGATGLARRVIAAVAAGDPVTAGGRSFPPRVVGAVAGGAPGQQLSFATLMKNATRALEQARRDGAELAVQP
jgi:PleD family two-component response regulator